MAEERKKLDKLNKNSNIEKTINSTNLIKQQKTNITTDKAIIESKESARDFRSDSPPVPAVGNKIVEIKRNINNSNALPPPPLKPNNERYRRPTTNSTADYYTTESRLNVSSPVFIKKIITKT